MATDRLCDLISNEQKIGPIVFYAISEVTIEPEGIWTGGF